MCIIFLYNGENDKESDFRLIVASNRDEYFSRAAHCLAAWKENSNIYGGRDFQSGKEEGTWFGINIELKKIGVLLNLPGTTGENVISRGNIVSEYLMNVTPASKYIETLQTVNKYNGFVLVTAEFRNSCPIIQTYNNETNEWNVWSDEILGFSNSVPVNPLKKVDYGKSLLKQICQKHKKENTKKYLIEELLGLLQNKESQLPDPQLEKRKPKMFKELSSIHVRIQEQYGTRAHTLFILTKSGHIDLIEVSLESPINLENPTWKRSEYQFNIYY
ncbi:transport and Golgi organization protein 2 [Aricia agestis]|uniref:transport and Golgi organization protein 2 n=1 Tax=Aricia agestis TaxID=91739 RepID=UPI001C20AA04|nr:transport and Golgi organization protein 2 [Aricia agestis]XP_041972504.1 transport and Golgi organization protein 2 [Aricia agestis]